MGVDERLLGGRVHFLVRGHVTDAEVHRERHHLRVLFRRRTGPVRDIGVAGGVDHLAGLDADEAVLVRDDDGGDEAALGLDIADQRVVKDGEVLGVAADEAVHEQLELVGVGDVDRAPVFRDEMSGQVVDALGVGLGEAEFAEEFQGDPADDEASGRFVDQTVEVR